MKIYTRLGLDMHTGEILEENAYEYLGPVAECKGTSTNSVDKAYNARMATLSEEQQAWARDYYNLWSTYQKPYEIAQAQTNLEMLPLESKVYKQTLQSAQQLVPAQTQAGLNFLNEAAKGLDVNERVGLAAADASSAWQDATASTARDNARMGVNPNSGRFAGLNASLATAQAAQMAGAKTQARTLAEQENFERKAKAASYGGANQYLQGLGFTASDKE